MSDRRVLLVAPLDGHTNLYVRAAFRQLGWKVAQVDYREAVRQAGRTLGNVGIVTAAERGKPDLVLVLKGEMVEPSTCEAIREAGITTALWHFDPRDGTVGWVVERARAVDHFFTIAEGLVPWYEEREVNAHWLLEGADPEHHRPVDVPRQWTMGFIGTVDGVPGREPWLSHLAREIGTAVHVWGSFPPAARPSFVLHGRAAGDPGFCEAVGQTIVNLGRDRNPEIRRSYGARLFRTLAAGGFLLTNRTVGIDHDFKGCVGVYDSDKDCAQQVLHFLGAHEERLRTAAHGRARVLERHLFVHRIRELVLAVGLP